MTRKSTTVKVSLVLPKHPHTYTSGDAVLSQVAGTSGIVSAVATWRLDPTSEQHVEGHPGQQEVD